MNKLYFDHELTAAYLDEAKRELFLTRVPTARAARVRSPRSPQRRAERAAAEACIRRLCRQAGEDYASLVIAYTEEGKPYVDGRPDITLSISHTAYLAAVVLIKTDDASLAPAVGLDVAARGDAPKNADRIALRFFSPEEIKSLRDLCEAGDGLLEDGIPAPDSDAFLATWCRMEARVKMSGEGIGSDRPPTEPHARRAYLLSPLGAPAHHVAIALSGDVAEK